MASARRLAANIFTTWFANIVKVVIQLVMLPLMARLLGPEELGLYSLAMPVLSFVSLLSDGGLGDSLAREKSADDTVWSSAFWGLLCSGVLLSSLLFGASFVIGAYAGQPRLPLIMLPLSATLLMVAATVIPSARMLQSGRAGYGALGDLIGYTVGAVLAVYLAFHGWGVWSMVAQYVATFFIRMVSFNIFSPFWPKFTFDLKTLLSHWGIGGAILGGRLADLAGRTLENTQISRILGAAALGTYSYSNQVPRFLSEAASNPIWHNLYYLCFSGDPEKIPTHYIRHNRLIALVVFPASTLLAVTMPQVVPLLLGPKWHAAIYPMAALLVTYPFMALGNQTGAVLFAKGNGRVPFIGSLSLSIVRVIIVSTVGILGMQGLAWALGASNVLYWIILSVYCKRFIHNKTSDLMLALVGPFMASAIAGLSIYFLVGNTPTIIWLLISGVIAFVIYILSLFAIDRPRVMADATAVYEMIAKKAPHELQNNGKV